MMEIKNFFDQSGENRKKRATGANAQLMHMLNNTNLKKLTGNHQETETLKLATEFSSPLPTILIKQK